MSLCVIPKRARVCAGIRAEWVQPVALARVPQWAKPIRAAALKPKIEELGWYRIRWEVHRFCELELGVRSSVPRFPALVSTTPELVLVALHSTG